MPLLRDGTYWPPGAAETTIRIGRRMGRAALTAALRDWRGCHLRGMRGYYRNAVRDAIRLLREADHLERLL